MVLKAWTGRTKTVVFVYLISGSYVYTSVSGVIFRPQAVIDPEIPNEAGAAPKTPFDVIMLAPLTVSFTGLQYVADTTTATSGGVAAANKYEAIEIVPTGIVPGGSHYEVSLRRLR